MAESKKNHPRAFWIDAVRSIGHRLSLPTMALSACYFIIIKHIPLKQKAERIFYNFAEHSFGIYLLHIYIIRHGLWPMFQEWALPTAVAIPMLVITGAAASYLAVALLTLPPPQKQIHSRHLIPPSVKKQRTQTISHGRDAIIRVHTK